MLTTSSCCLRVLSTSFPLTHGSSINVGARSRNGEAGEETCKYRGYYTLVLSEVTLIFELIKNNDLTQSCTAIIRKSM